MTGVAETGGEGTTGGGSGPSETGESESGETDTGETGETSDTGDVPSGNDLNQDALFTCTDQPAMPIADARLLDRDEWTRAVGSWSSSNLSRNPLYPRAEHHYSTYSEGEGLDSSLLSLYLDVVTEAGASWTVGPYDAGHLRTVREDPETLCMLKDEEPTPECVVYYVRRYLERGSLYRAASDEEVDALYDFAQSRLADEISYDDRQATIKKIAAAAWMTSGALYRPEVGAGSVDEFGRVRLSDWELAQAITYALSRAAPRVPSVYRSWQAKYSKGDVDGYMAPFAVAAEDGSIKDPEVVGELVRAYIGGEDPQRADLILAPYSGGWWHNQGEFWTANGVQGFFQEWLDYGDLAAQSPKVGVADTSAWSGSSVEKAYQNTISASFGRENTLMTQLDDMIARILADDKDVFRELMTSRMFYTPATAGYQQGESYIWQSTAKMNRVYNVEGVTEQTREARWIELPEAERAGVLTHPAWLSAHSLSFENDPNLVHRGKWIREELLCQNIPELPINVDAALSEESKMHSARQRVSEQIDSDPYCAGCHQLMNPLGLPFEIYNHAGFVRVEDHGGDPDGTSTLENMPSPELNGPVNDAVDLSTRLGSSPYAKRCFIRQSFRYFSGREETMADACTMVALEEAYDESGGSFTELFIAIVNSDSFQLRVSE